MRSSVAPRSARAEDRQLREAVRRHYDDHPFFLHPRRGPSDGKFFELSLSGALVRSALRAGDLVLDIGCGPGRVASWLMARPDVTSIGMDLSLRELAEAKQDLGLSVVNGDCLQLPFRDGAADVTIAAGVIHHTVDPRRAFGELCRVTRPGGLVHVAVYQRGSLYHWQYRCFAPWHRFLRRVGGDRMLRLMSFSMYYLSFRLFLRWGLRVREHVERDDVWRFFLDQFLVPCVSFLSVEEMERWAHDEGLSVVRGQQEFMGEQIAFVFRKGGTSRASPTAN